MTFPPVKTRPAKSYSHMHRQIEIFFANLFDALVLMRLHSVVIIIIIIIIVIITYYYHYYHYHYHYYFI